MTTIAGDAARTTRGTVALDEPAIARLASRLTDVVGARHLLQRPSALRVYDSDGLPGYSAAACARGASRHARRADRRRAGARGGGRAVRGARRGHRALGRRRSPTASSLVGLNRLNRILAIDAENRLAVVEPGVVNATLTRAAARVRAALRARSVQPERVHHRRQRGGERRRPALPQVRRDAEPRRRRHRAAARRRGRHARRRGRRGRRLRPARRVRRQRGLLRRRARRHGPAGARSAGGAHAARRLRAHRRRGARGVGASSPRASCRPRSR